MLQEKLPDQTKCELVPITAAVHPLQVYRKLKPVEVGRTLLSVAEELCPPEFRDRLVISVDGEIVPEEQWEIKRVAPSNVIVLRAVPQQSTVKQIERIVLTIAVVAIAFAILGPPGAFSALGFEAGSAGALAIYGAAMTGITAIGSLAINALIPPSSINSSASTRTFGVSGIQNQELPYGVVPRICGRTLITPPKGAHSYTVATGSDVYLFALFDLGPGPIAISDIKIGQTPIDDFADVQYETREGRDTDTDLTIFTNAVTQTPLSIGMNHQGDIATQRTPLNTSHIELDISNPGGLFQSDNKGNLQNYTQSLQVVVKDLSGNVLQSHTITMTNASTSAVSQTFIMDDRTPGQYDITVERLDSGPSSNRGSAQPFWTALRTWGPTSGPLLPKNHAKIAVRIKATEQLNGDIANLSCIGQAYVNVWDGTAFTEALNTHPAWQALKILQDAGSNARPLDQSRIDLASLKEWADTYPSAEFNYVFSSRTTIWQSLRTIGSAGRAVPVIRDGLYGFIFDHTQDTPVQVFTTRNVHNFKATKNFFDEVQAMEVRYISETMGWQQHSVYVYADGFNADNVDGTKISPLDLTGVTSDDWAYKLGTYFFACSILRPTVYQFDTDLDHLACNPGDRVWVQHDVIDAGLMAGRIKSLTRDGSTHLTSVTLDEKWTGDGTSSYSIIIRTALGTIYTVPITLATSETHTFSATAAFDDSGDPVANGDLVALVTTSKGMLDAIVKTVVPKPDFQASVVLLDYAPSVHDGDAVVPPPVVNDRIDKFVHALPVSTVVIDSLIADEDSSMRDAKGTLTPQIHGHFYIEQDGITPTQFDLQYRVDGSVGWIARPTLPIDAREFYVPIGYDSVGLTYNVRIRGNAGGQNPGPWNEANILIAQYTVAPVAPTLAITPVITGVLATITPPDSSPVSEYRLYASQSEDFATADLVASGQSQPLKAAGLATGVYFFWATTVNGAGVESSPSNDVSAVPLPIGYFDFKDEVNNFIANIGKAVQDVQDAVQTLTVASANAQMGGYEDYQTLQNAISAASATLTASYTSAITAATGPGSALVTDITNLQSALSGYTGANAVSTAVNSLQTQITTNAGNISTVSSSITSLQSALSGYTGANAVSAAVSSLQTQITTADGSITANANSITALNSQVGNFYASGLFRVLTSATPSGADARIELGVAASAGGSPYTAALFLDAMSGGVSRVTIVADKFFVTDGTNTHSPFFFSGGTAFLDSAVLQNINAATITAGTLNVGTLVASGSIVTSHLAGAAVTAPSYAVASAQTISNSAPAPLVSITKTTFGGDVLLNMNDYFVRSGGHSPAVKYLIEVDAGTGGFNLVWSGGSGVAVNQPVASNYLATGVSAGSHTFAVYAVTDGTDPGCTSEACTLMATELKR